MKKALQALRIVPDRVIRADIVSGKKKIAVRHGFIDFHRGRIMLCCHLEPWAVMADVIQVRHCLAAKLTALELQATGFASKAEMAKRIRPVEPNFSLASPVTVIRWTNVRGQLVDIESRHNRKFKLGDRVRRIKTDEIYIVHRQFEDHTVMLNAEKGGHPAEFPNVILELVTSKRVKRS